jgi:hypothetical protein
MVRNRIFVFLPSFARESGCFRRVAGWDVVVSKLLQTCMVYWSLDPQVRQ